MHGMAPHMHMACKEEQEDFDGEVAEGARAVVAGTPFSAIVSIIVCSLQPEPLGTAPGSERPPAQGAEAVLSLKADRHTMVGGGRN